MNVYLRIGRVQGRRTKSCGAEGKEGSTQKLLIKFAAAAAGQAEGAAVKGAKNVDKIDKFGATSAADLIIDKTKEKALTEVEKNN